jgi:Spy/CpxP family protein refolding chaperone
MAVDKKTGFLATSLLLGSLSVGAFGQAQPGGNPPPGGNGGPPGRGNFDPAQFRQRMMDRLKEQLGASDDEMQAMMPKIEKVMQLQRDAGGGGMRGMGRRGGGPGGPGGPPPGGPGGPGGTESPVRQKATELRETLDNKDAKPDEIKAKLDALRSARAQAKLDLAAAQQDLKGLLTQRQEAVLVEFGMLE